MPFSQSDPIKSLSRFQCLRCMFQCMCAFKDHSLVLVHLLVFATQHVTLVLFVSSFHLPVGLLSGGKQGLQTGKCVTMFICFS